MSKQIESRAEALERIDARIKATEEHLERSGSREQEHARAAVELLSKTNATTGKSRLEELIEQMGKEHGIRDRYNDQVLPLLSASAPTGAQARRFIDQAAARADNSMRLNGVTSDVAAEFTIAGESKQDLNERVEGHMLKEHTESLVGKRDARLQEQQQKNAIEMDLFGFRLKQNGHALSDNFPSQDTAKTSAPFHALHTAILKQAHQDAQVAGFFNGPDASVGKAGKLGFNASKPEDQQALTALSRHHTAARDVAKDSLRLGELYELRGKVFEGSLEFDNPTVVSATRMSSDNLSPKTRAALARGEERHAPDMRLIDQLGRDGLQAKDALSLPPESVLKSAESAHHSLQSWIQGAAAEPPSSDRPAHKSADAMSPLEERVRKQQEERAAIGADPANTRHSLSRDQGAEALADARRATAQALEKKSMEQGIVKKTGETYGQ